jgi:choline dehydrogenase-like flavoprotein
MFYETSEAGLTIDHLLYHDNNLAESYRQWKEERQGALSNFPFGAFAYARLDDRLADDPIWTSAKREPGKDPMGLTQAQPNIEFFSTECYGGPKHFVDFPIEHKHCFSLIAELFSPRSKGSVRLRSADPKDNPIVDHNYLADPLDVLVLSEACALGNEIITKQPATKTILKGSWPPSLTHHTYTKRKDWEDYVRENATTCMSHSIRQMNARLVNGTITDMVVAGYHPGGTAKMGLSDDPMAVLDERLRVRGVKCLRVADTSIMPTLNQGG